MPVPSFYFVSIRRVCEKGRSVFFPVKFNFNLVLQSAKINYSSTKQSPSFTWFFINALAAVHYQHRCGILKCTWQTEFFDWPNRTVNVCYFQKWKCKRLKDLQSKDKIFRAIKSQHKLVSTEWDNLNVIYDMYRIQISNVSVDVAILCSKQYKLDTITIAQSRKVFFSVSCIVVALAVSNFTRRQLRTSNNSVIRFEKTFPSRYLVFR